MGTVASMPVDGPSRQPLGLVMGVDPVFASGLGGMALSICYRPNISPKRIQLRRWEFFGMYEIRQKQYDDVLK